MDSGHGHTVVRSSGIKKRSVRKQIQALFSLQKFLDFATVVFLFLFDNYCLIID